MANKGNTNPEITVRLAHKKDQERNKVLALKAKHDAWERNNNLVSKISADGKTTFFAKSQEKINESVSKYNKVNL
jgi:hypothetical protein